MVCMCVKRDAKEAESRAGRGERCRPRIRLRGDSVWMAVVPHTAAPRRCRRCGSCTAAVSAVRMAQRAKACSVLALLLLLGLAGALANHRTFGLVPSNAFISADASGGKTLEVLGVALDGELLEPPRSYKEVEQCVAACRVSPDCDYFMHCDSTVRLWQPPPALLRYALCRAALPRTAPEPLQEGCVIDTTTMRRWPFRAACCWHRIAR